MTKDFPVTQLSRVYQCPPADGNIPLPLSPTLKIRNPIYPELSESLSQGRFFFPGFIPECRGVKVASSEESEGRSLNKLIIYVTPCLSPPPLLMLLLLVNFPVPF